MGGGRLHTFASQAIGRRRKSGPAALAGEGAGAVHTNSRGAHIAGRTLVNIWRENTHLQMLTVKPLVTFRRSQSSSPAQTFAVPAVRRHSVAVVTGASVAAF